MSATRHTDPTDINKTMARHFREQDIDEFRDCFYLNTCSSGQISDVKELKTIMRSLGMSPTIPELEVYMKGKGMHDSFLVHV